jgi:hypothetical protein
LIDMKDRRACLAKPSGVGSAGSVGQSGISKQLDAETGHKLLSSIATGLAKAERVLAEYALMVFRKKAVASEERAMIKVGYPSRFELNNAADLIDGTSKLQLVLGACGNAPNTERELIQATIRQLLVGLGDDEYKALDDEIELLVKTKSQLKERVRELPDAMIQSRAEVTGEGSEEQQAGEDPTGQSAVTMVT